MWDADQVDRFVDDAFQASTRQWVPGKAGEAAADMDDVRSAFSASRHAPLRGEVVIESHTAAHLGVRAGPLPVWFVARAGDHHVFLDAFSRVFGVAWGPDATTGELYDLGFRTPDPLDAFLT